VSWSLAALIVVQSGAVAWRRRHLPQDDVYIFYLPAGRWPLITLVLALILGVTTWMIAGAALQAVRPEFSVTGPNGQLSGYPFQVRENARSPLVLHIDNPTGHPLTYQLVMTDGGKPTINGGSTLRDEPIRVAARARWSEAVLVPSAPPSRVETVALDLYQGKETVRRLLVRYQIVP
jgi:hypothetical protein